MQGSVGLQFRVLGPLEVRDNDRCLALGGFQQRLLLAALLAHPNAVVSADRLIDILWGDGLPEGATTTLAKSVYRLRATFGSAGAPGVLITRTPGYVLSVGADQVDSDRFASLLSEAHGSLDVDAGKALALLDQALPLWRGPAWAEFADYDFARADITRLEALRTVAADDRADALLALGRHEELVPDLEATAAEFPLRERPRAQLMLALYRSGRQADALAVYRRFCRALMDEVGLQPSADLQRLEHDVLQQRAELDLQPQRTRLGPAPRIRVAELLTGDEKFLGRTRDLNWLEVLFDQAVAGQGPVLALLSSGAGAGKTSLVRAFGRLVHSRGAEVVFARCADAVAATAAVAEALGVPMTAAAGTGLDPGATLHAIEEGLAAVCAGGPLLLVLDDLDADRLDDRSVLGRLASLHDAGPMCIVGTCRERAEELAVGAGSAVQLRTLGGLDRAGVADLLAGYSGVVRSPELVDSVCAETAGLPALVVAVARRLRDLDVAARADRALARAEGARENWAAVRADVALGVLARGQLLPRPAGLPADRGLCPYKGLAPFGAADAALFSGRERLVASLVARLAVDRFLSVVGPSGSGKSSLVAAGLIPALTSGGLPGSQRWPCRIMRPGSNPMHALASVLAPLLDEPAPGVQSRLELDPAELDGVVCAALDSSGSGERLVLVVDQFEEVFTACADAAARSRFIRVLVEGPGSAASRLVVAVVIRADYYGSCAEHVELARLLGHSQVIVPAMTDAELRRAVLEPALRGGLTVEDGLADAVVADAAGEPGALPLVSTALLETWVRRSESTLTLAGYAEAGGVRGAVGRLADGVYDALDPTGQAIARRVFLRLAEPSGDRTDVRRRAPREELAGTDAEQVVLAHLIDRRLLTATEDTVEVAHEALLREWPRLRGWLEEGGEGRRLHRRLAEAAQAWRADLRDDSGLYRGVRLHAARDWAESHPGDLNRLETEFLTTSEAAEQRNVHATRRTARRLRMLAAGLAALLVLAVAAGALAALQRTQARRSATLARARALLAETSRMAELARSLPNDQRDLALLLGIEGYRLLPSDQTVGDLQAALIQTPPGLDRIIRYRSTTNQPHLDRAGRLLAVPGAAGVTVYDVITGKVVHTLNWPRSREFAVFNSDDTRIAAGGSDGQVAIWDARTGELSGKPINAGAVIADPLFDPNNPDHLYVFTDTGVLTSWNLSDPQHPRQVGQTREFDGGDLSGGGDGESVATISPDGQLIAAADASGGPIIVWNLRTGTTLTLPEGELGVFGPDSTTLPIGLGNETVLYNARTGLPGPAVPSPAGSPPNAVLSPDGRRIAVPERQNASQVAVYDLGTRQPVGPPLQLHGNGASPVGFLPDGRLLTTGSAEAALWTVGRRVPQLAVPLPAPEDYNASVFMPGSDEVVTRGARFRELIRHSERTGTALGPLLSGAVQGPIVPSPDGKLIAAGVAHHEEFGIWSMRTGKRLTLMPDLPFSAQLAWSPNGRQLAADFGPSIQIWDVTRPDHPALSESIPTVHGVPRPDYLLFSPDGRRILTAESEDRRLTMSDIGSHHVQWSVQINDLTLGQVAFSPNGNTVAVNSGDPGQGHLTLYRSATGTTGPNAPIQSIGGIGYLHGGRWLVATAGQSAPAAQLYDAANLQPIGIPFPLNGSGSFGNPLATNPAGTMFSEAEYDAPLLWDADPTRWQATACRIAGRNLTQAEWREYIPSRPYQTTCPEWPRGQ